ncbi:MAG: OmpA family protein [Candidatus Hydrogenedentes bacterium]|nr:OmpA family protein [Candidatus Hydrogenedentota bacterium]
MNAKASQLHVLTAIVTTLTLLTASGCHTQGSRPANFGGSAGNEGGTTLEQNGLDHDDDGSIPAPGPGIQVIYFDYDSAVLRADARESLKANAERFRRMPKVTVQIAGHCDERGTQQYNLALGEHRAIAAREYLVQLGIPAERLITISYGSEQPADPGKDEAAWAKNRRCEFNRAM